MSWAAVLVNVKDMLQEPPLATLELGVTTEDGMELCPSRSPLWPPAGFPPLLKEEMEVGPSSPYPDSLLIVTDPRLLPVRLNVVVHKTAA